MISMIMFFMIAIGLIVGCMLFAKTVAGLGTKRREQEWQEYRAKLVEEYGEEYLQQPVEEEKYELDYTECDKKSKSYQYVYAREQNPPAILIILCVLFTMPVFIFGFEAMEFLFPILSISFIFGVPIVIMLVRSKYYRPIHRDIKNHGKRFKGEVYTIEKYNGHLTSRYRKTGQRSGGVYKYDYKLLVRYYDEYGNMQTMDTPKIGVAFNSKNLKHSPCYVYIYGDKKLATDFARGFKNS